MEPYMESYRVRKQFQWDGMYYAPTGPSGECPCQCKKGGLKCTHMVGTGCECATTSCHCSCGIKQAMYGGDVSLVEEGHPRKEHMITQHFATYDATLPSVDELINQDAQPKRGRPKAAV